MPPPKTKKSVNEWWNDRTAYVAHPHIVVQYELEFKKDVIRPGNQIKIKNLRSTFRFRCLAHNIKLDTTWIDCMDVNTGEWRSFRPEQIRNLVKPKRSYRKRKNAKVATSKK